MRFGNVTIAIPLLAALHGAVSCTTGSPSEPAARSVAATDQGEPPVGPPPFLASPPRVYVAKIKNVLVGLPPTDAEVARVERDPGSIGELITSWIESPALGPLYQAKMLRFFELAFQQTQISLLDFANQAYPALSETNPVTGPAILQLAQESMARTALHLASEGLPLTDAMTTHTFMMTPALMEFYAFLDAWQVDDYYNVTDRFAAAYPKASIVIQHGAGPVPLAESIDPASPSFMRWYLPDLPAAQAALGGPPCGGDPLVVPADAKMLHLLLLGSIEPRVSSSGSPCPGYAGTASSPQLVPGDFTDWKLVTIRQPRPGESPTWFFDLPALRASSELVLRLPRVGFFTTPAFFANWQTNTSNTMRVTLNQALIVATGMAMDGTDPTIPPSTPGLDSTHAAPGSPCYGCHRLLDPSRSILAATYSFNYHAQEDPLLLHEPGLFAFQGVINANIRNVDDLGATLASHPLLPTGWVNKLCYYVNSTRCDPTDPEVVRISDLFKSSGYKWKALVVALLASPLTTRAAPTGTTARNGEVVAVSRRDHLCAALGNRLGLGDVCGLSALTPRGDGYVDAIVSGLPSDGYGRGAPTPVLPTRPSLFYRAAVENICERLAEEVVDPAGPPRPGARRWSSAEPGSAIHDFVDVLLGLTPSDARYARAERLLSSHFVAATAEASTTDALRSTFVAACLSPSSVAVGM